MQICSINFQKCSTRGLDRFVNSVDTFWLPKIIQCTYFVKRYAKYLYFNKKGGQKQKISSILKNTCNNDLKIPDVQYKWIESNS